MNMSYEKNVAITTSDLNNPKLHITYNNAAGTIQAVVSGEHDGKQIVSDPVIGTSNVNREIRTVCAMLGLPLRALAAGIRDEDKIIRIDRDVLDDYDVLSSNKLLRKKTAQNQRGNQQQAQQQNQQGNQQQAQQQNQQANQQQTRQQTAQNQQQTQQQTAQNQQQTRQQTAQNQQQTRQQTAQNQQQTRQQTAQNQQQNGQAQNNNRIKKLKTAGKVLLATLLTGYIVVGGYNTLFKNDNKESGNKNGSGDDNNPRYDQGVEDQGFETSKDAEERLTQPDDAYAEENAPYHFENLGSAIGYDDMQTQIDGINQTCFEFQPCTLENLVVHSDREAVYTINNMRNKIFTGQCDVNNFLNNVVNYIFENGTVFDGKVIKGYDSLSPYAQYIVLVASQSALQLNTSYEHSTPSNTYDFDVLVNSFDYMVDSTYRELMNISRTR